MAAVRVLHKIQISPSLPSQPPQPLSFLDGIWLRNSQLVERLFFYHFPHPISHFVDRILPIFTKSLSLTLHRFYLLAGSIRRHPDSDAQFEIVYTEGDSVAITVAEFTGDDFSNISGHHPRSFNNLRLLVPKPAKPAESGGQDPAISIQITLFPNEGLCIGFAINHAACDGSASMQFIRSWAAACRSSEPTLDEISPPLLDRSIIIDTHGLQQKINDLGHRYREVFAEHLKKQDSLPVSDPSLVYATFTLAKDQIARLKERAQAKGGEEGKPSFHMSAFVVTSAYVWRCLVKARGYDGDVEEHFAFAVDWRSRMRPPIPSNYFGNCLGACSVGLKAADLVGKEGIEVAAMEIGKGIDGLQGRDVSEVLIEAIDRFVELPRSKPLSVAGSPKLRVYEADFGLGRPAKVDVTSIHGTSAMSLAESRAAEGGVEIGLVLPAEEMMKFVKIFSDDLLQV